MSYNENLKVLLDALESDALIDAIIKDKEDEVRELVKRVANINFEINGWTPLICAIARGNINIVQCLIDKGAMLDKETSRGYTPLMMAIDTCNENVESSSYAIKYLVRHGVDVNKEDSRGITPLMIACDVENIAVVKYLVSHGAKIHGERESGKNLIRGVYNKGNYQICDYLINEECKRNKNLKLSDISFLLGHRSHIEESFKEILGIKKELKESDSIIKSKSEKINNIERERTERESRINIEE